MSIKFSFGHQGTNFIWESGATRLMCFGTFDDRFFLTGSERVRARNNIFTVNRINIFKF